MKTAGTIAQDIVRALYGLDQKKLSDKFKYVIIPYIKYGLQRVLYNHIVKEMFSPASCRYYKVDCREVRKLTPEEVLDLATKYIETGEVPAVFEKLGNKELIDDLLSIIKAFAHYVEFYKFIKQLEKQPVIDSTAINRLMDFLHGSAGFYFKFFKTFGWSEHNPPDLFTLSDIDMLTGTKSFTLEAEHDKIDNLLDGLITVIENDPELKNLLPQAMQFKEEWKQLKEDLSIMYESVHENEGKEVPVSTLAGFLSTYDCLEQFGKDLCDKYDQKYKQLIEEFKKLLAKVGGQSSLFKIILSIGKPELELELRDVLPYEEQKELFYDDLINKRQITYRDQRPSFDEVIAKHWCYYINTGQHGKLINEVEFYLADVLGTEMVVRRLLDFDARNTSTTDLVNRLIDYLEKYLDYYEDFNCGQDEKFCKEIERKVQRISTLVKALKECMAKKSATLLSLI